MSVNQTKKFLKTIDSLVYLEPIVDPLGGGVHAHTEKKKAQSNTHFTSNPS